MDGQQAAQGAGAHDLEIDLPENAELETIRIIAEHAGRSYGEEVERVKGLDAKAGLLFSATGAVIGLVAGTLSKAPEPIATLPPGTAEFVRFMVSYVTLVVLTLLLLFAAEICFLVAVRLRTFDFLASGAWLDRRITGLRPLQAHAYFAQAYVQARYRSRRAAANKACALTLGQWMLFAALSLLVLGVAPCAGWAAIERPHSVVPAPTATPTTQPTISPGE